MTAHIVKIQDFSQRLKTTVVHVGVTVFDIPQGRYLEFTAVGWISSNELASCANNINTI